MSKIKAILIGIFIWVLGASFYSASYFFPFLEDLELQANLILAITFIPNAWFGASIYYKTGGRLHGARLATIVLLIALLLDVIITVPFLIIPESGDYQSFFGAPAFWLIAVEYYAIVFLYWNTKVKSEIINTH